jgi:opacity protein-like surface antigen
VRSSIVERRAGGAPFVFAALLAGAALSARPALAQDTGRWEVGAFTGGYFGSRIFLDRSTDIEIGKSTAYGLRGAFSVDRTFSLELTLSRTSGRLAAVDPSTGASLAPSASIDVNTYELDGLYGFGSGRMRGYMGLGVGAMTLHPFVPGIATEADTRPVANIALGGKLYLSDRLALRVDGRYRWRSASRGNGTVVCGSLGCYGFTADLYSSGEVTAGLSYRFGGARIWDLPAAPASPTSSAVLAAPSTRSAPPEHFLTAAGEIALVELLPWGFDRYVTQEDFAFISLRSVKENFKNGFGYDRDSFNINQASHPFHGSLYFNAARSNGYGYWESGAFTLAGSFLWECCMENTQPSINDIVNTTLGGMSRGEMAHRLGVMLRDNTASGFTRFWRELAGAIVDPVGGFNRLAHGETSRQFANPDERFPSRFSVVGDLGYRHIGGGAADPNQAIVSLSAVYGDAFAGEIRKPFDTFWLEADISSTGVSRVEGRGVLKGWELSDSTARFRHILGVFQEYEYFSNESQVFAAQIFSVGLLSRYSLGPNLKISTDVTAIAFPLAGIRTTDFLNPETGRSYDYAPGGGFRVAGRLYRKEWEIVRLGYGVAFARTANGTSSSNTLQFFRASARLPLTRSLGVGGGYSWYSRKTTYSGFQEAPRTQSEWRLFVSWSL